jgi:hypothetical protein
MLKLNALVAPLFALFLGMTCASAQTDTIAPYEIVPDGREYTINLGANERNVREISVYFVSTGNISSAVEIKVAAPVGVKGSARFGYLGDQDPQIALASSPLIQAAKIRNSQRKENPTFPIIEESNGYGSAYVWYHLEKDACSGNKSSKYITQVKLDLSGINPSLYDGVFSITVALKEYKFTGAKVASIKPSSDGKYKGEPILLMGSIDYGNEYVNIVGWKGNKIASNRRIPVVKYVGYKGYSLSLARLKGYLNGGKFTFELSNGGDVYGVCFSAVRRRQVTNGYPK